MPTLSDLSKHAQDLKATASDGFNLRIHRTLSWLKKAESAKQADDLDKITQASVNAYMQEINITEDELKQMLDDETWITPQEAIEKGFITAIVNEKEAEEVSQSVKKSLMKLILNAKKEDDLNTEINNSEENKSKEPEEHTKCSFFNEFKNKLNRKGGQQ